MPKATTEGVKPYFQPRPRSEILTIANSKIPQAGFESVQNLSSGFVERNCAVIVITSSPQLYHMVSATQCCFFSR